MVVIIIIDNDNNLEDEIEEEKQLGEEWMYDENINSGIY